VKEKVREKKREVMVMNCGIASVVITWVRYGVATIIAAADGVTAEADTTVS